MASFNVNDKIVLQKTRMGALDGETGTVSKKLANGSYEVFVDKFGDYREYKPEQLRLASEVVAAPAPTPAPTPAPAPAPAPTPAPARAPPSADRYSRMVTPQEYEQLRRMFPGLRAATPIPPPAAAGQGAPPLEKAASDPKSPGGKRRKTKKRITRKKRTTRRR